MPGAGGTQRLIRSVGKSLASKMVLSGESITAQQAQQAGLVSDVFPSDLTLEYALQLASKMARHSPLALQAAKQALRQSQEVALQAGLAQSDSYSPCWRQQKIVMKASPLSTKTHARL